MAPKKTKPANETVTETPAVHSTSADECAIPDVKHFADSTFFGLDPIHQRDREIEIIRLLREILVELRKP